MLSDFRHPPISRLRRRAAGAVLLAGTLVSCRRVAPAAAGIRDAPPADARRAEAPRAAVRPAASGYAFIPAEAAAVEEFLHRNPTLRLATDADRRRAAGADAELRGLYGVYHPYFVRGDMNDDGVLDFVVGFVRRDNAPSAPWFSVVVFTGKPGPGAAAFSGGTFLERDVTLARGDVSVDRDSIVITPDLDEESVRRYKWDTAGRAFVFVPDDGDETDPPSVTQTSLPLGRGPAHAPARGSAVASTAGLVPALALAPAPRTSSARNRAETIRDATGALLNPGRLSTRSQARPAARLWPRPLRTLVGPKIPSEAISSPPAPGERAG